MWKYIVDFYCHELGLVIEIDGDIHDLQPDEDRARQDYLENLGLKVLRFKNEEILNKPPLGGGASQKFLQRLPFKHVSLTFKINTDLKFPSVRYQFFNQII